MAHNVISFPVLLLGYTLCILLLGNGTEGNILDKCNMTQGFFIAPGTGQSQCLKVFSGIVSWYDARDKYCRDEGLELARPFNALQLRRYILERYSFWNFWVNAKENGTEMLWTTKRDNIGRQEVRSNNPLWREGEPGKLNKDKSISIWKDKKDKSLCMVLASSPSSIISQPEAAYFVAECSDTDTAHPLCELDLTKP